jgi:hypothetical protein
MLRIHGRLSLAAAFLCAGLAHAGPTAPAKKSADDDKIMTINDGGKAHRCQVLRSYKHPSGGMAYEVKDLESGEIMTVIENPAATKAASTPAPTKPASTPPSIPAPAKAAKADPIMQPKQYVDNKKVQQQLGNEPSNEETPAAKYTQAPTPAAKRWLAKASETKPAAEIKPAAKAMAVVVVPPVEAIRHPDPVFRLIGCLRDDMLPSMREIAAETLASSEGRNRPEVISALEEAAEKDPAQSVRACCSRCLGEMRGR